TGENIAMAVLNLTVDDLPPWSVQWPLGRVAPRSDKPTAVPAPSVDAVWPRFNFAGALQNGSLLTVLPGQSVQVPLQLVDAGSATTAATTWQVVRMQLEALHGWLWWDVATRNHVQYMVGSKNGGRVLAIESTFGNLAQALSGLHYTSPASFYGMDLVTFVLSGLDAGNGLGLTIQLHVAVPLTLVPPTIVSLSSTLLAVEDTAVVLRGYQANFSSTTPSNCSTALVVKVSAQSGRVVTAHAVPDGGLPLELHSTDPQTPVSMTDAWYHPKANFAGMDTLSFHAIQTVACPAKNVSSEAFLDVSVFVEPVPDPLELIWPAAATVFTISTWSNGWHVLPPVKLTAVDADVAWIAPPLAVELSATALEGSVSFSKAKPTTSSVVCSVQDATTYLGGLVYAVPTIATTSGTLPVGMDRIIVSARKFGSNEPPVTVALSVSLPTAPAPACADFSDVEVDVLEDSIVELHPFVVRLCPNHTVVAAVKHGWLSLRTDTPWVKQVTLPSQRTDLQLLYQPAVDFFGQDALQLSCRHGPAVVSVSTLPLAVHPVNDPPAWIVAAEPVPVENATTSVCNWWSLRDVDASATTLYRVEIAIDDAVGRLVLPAFMPGVFVELDHGTKIVLQGSLGQLNALFASCTVSLVVAMPTTISTNGTIALCGEEVVDDTPNRHHDPQCASLRIAVMASTAPRSTGLVENVPSLEYTSEWVGVEDVPGPVVGLFFDASAATATTSMRFVATKGVVLVHSFHPCVQHLGAGWIAGDVPCLQTVLASTDVWYRPLPNANGHDDIVITYGLDREMRVPVFIAPVVDIPVWDGGPHVAIIAWHVSHHESSVSWTAGHRRSLQLGDDDAFFALTVRTAFGRIGFAFIPGLSYPRIEPLALDVVGRRAQLNQLVASLEYVAVARGVNDTMTVALANATTLAIQVVVDAAPLSLIAHPLDDAGSAAIMETESMALYRMVELVANGSPLTERRNVTVTTRFGLLSSSDSAGQRPMLEWRDVPDKLRQLVENLVYTATARNGQSHAYDDEVLVQLWHVSLSSVASQVRIPIRVTPFRVPVSVACPLEPQLVRENAPTSMATWFSIPGGPRPNQVTRVHITSSMSGTRLQLAFTPGLIVSSLSWMDEVWFQGPASAVSDALSHGLSVHTSQNDTVAVAVTAGDSSASCAVHVVVPDSNHPPTIHFSSQPTWHVSVADPDTTKSGITESVVLVSIKSTTASFQLTSTWPPTIVHSVPSPLSAGPDALADVTFQVAWKDSNAVLAGLRCVAGYGGLDLFVDDLGHGVPAYEAKNVSQYVPCQFVRVPSQLVVVDAIPTKSNHVSNWSCTANRPCALPRVAIKSSSAAEIEHVTTSGLLSFVPEVQTIHTEISNPWNRIVDIVLGAPPLSPATQITLQVSWTQRRDDQVPTPTYSATVVCSAAAVASRFDEVTGAGSGRGVDESMQAKLESVLPMPVRVWRGPYATWKVELLRDNQGEVLWVVDITFVGATNGLVASVFTSQPPEIVTGSFSLAFAGASTPLLPATISALDMQAALESLQTIQFVSVVRTTTPDAAGGYTWTVTFLQSANGDEGSETSLPLLQVNATLLQPTPAALAGAGVDRTVGNQATVKIQRVQRGYGRPPALYHLNLTGTHVDMVFDVALVATSPLTSATFTLVWWQGKTSDWIQFNAVAMASQERMDRSLGGRESESLEAKLASVLPPSSTTSITRTGPDANNAFTWRVTVRGAPASLPLPTVGSSTCGTVCSVQITSIQQTNAIGGSFVLKLGADATAPVAVSSPSLADHLTSALTALPVFVQLELKVIVRTSRRDLQVGCGVVVAFVQIDAASTPPLTVDASALTGKGATASLTTVDNFGMPAMVSWVVIDEGHTDLVLRQKHTGLNLVVEGTEFGVNGVLASLAFESVRWYGAVDITISLHDHDDARGTAVVLPMAVFQPPSSALSIELDGFTSVMEDASNVRLPLRLNASDDLALYTMIGISLTVSHGRLHTTAYAASPGIEMNVAAGVVSSVLDHIYYTPPCNFHGTEQLVAVLNNKTTRVFRWHVVPVNDAPIVHIDGSVEAPFTSAYFPVFEVHSPQDTVVHLPRISIEDVDDGSSLQLAPATTITLIVTATAGKLAVATLNGMRVVDESGTRLHVVGTALRLNAALSAVTCMPPTQFTGEIHISVWVQDSAGGATLEHVRHVTLHIAPVYALPRLNVGRAVYTAIEDTSLAVTDVAVADATPTAPPTVGLVRRLYKSLVLQPDTDLGLLAKDDNEWRLKLVDSTADNPRWFCWFQNRLYFAATSLQYGRELFVSDVGSVTEVAADVNPGFASSSPRYLTSFQGKLYFQASGLDLSFTLVDRMPSESGPCVAGRRTSSVSPDIVFVVGQSNVWQPAKTYDCPAGYAWMTTAQAKVAFTDTGSATTSPSFVFWNQCGWSQYTYQGVSRKWFRFADSAATGAFKHAGRVDGHPVEYGKTTSEFAGIVCIRVVDGADAPRESVLWQFDGLVATKVDLVGGNGMALPPYTSPQFLTVLTSAPWLVFQATTTAFGIELYRTNGISTFVDDLNLGPRSSLPSNFTEFQNRLVFAATSESAGRELWASASTIQVSNVGWAYNVVGDIAPGPPSSNPHDLVVCNSLLFFTADNGVSGREVWKWDGVAAPTIVQDLWPGATGSSPMSLTCYNNKVYFAAIASAALGVELYATAGTTISLVHDIAVGAGSSSPSFLTVQSVMQSSAVRTRLVFCMTGPRSPFKPTQTCTWYQSDGTSAGTIPLWDATSSSFEMDPDSFQVGAAAPGTMVFPVVVPATPAPRTVAGGVNLTLDIAVSMGAVSIAPLTASPSSVRVAVQSPQHLALTGSVQALNVALRGLRFLAPLNFHSDASAVLSSPPSSVDDASSPLIALRLYLTSQGQSTSASAAIYVDARDDSPVWLVPNSVMDPVLRTLDNLSPRIASIAPFSIDQDASWTFPPLQLRAVDCMKHPSVDGSYVDDDDAGRQCTLDVELRVRHGELSGCGREAPAPTIHLVGTVPVLNQLLRHVTYRPSPQYVGPDDLTLTATLVASSTVALPILVNAVNTVPFLAVRSRYFEVEEDRVLVLDGLTAVDSDVGEVLRVQLDVAYGTVALKFTSGVSAIPSSQGRHVEFSGGLQQVNMALANLTYVSAQHWNTDVGDDYDHVTITVTDLKAASTSTTIDVRVWPTPDDIFISVPSAADGTAAGTPVSSIVAGTIVVNEDEVLHVANLAISCVDAMPSSVIAAALFVTHGTLAVDIVPGVLAEAAASARQVSLTGSYDRINQALATLTYQSHRDYVGSDVLHVSVHSVMASDDGSDVPSLPGQRLVRLEIVGVNDPPTWSFADQRSGLSSPGASPIAPTFRLALSKWQNGLHLDGVSFHDVDAGPSDLLDVTIDVKVGSVTLSTLASLPNVVVVDGTGIRDAYVVLRGTETSLNAALRGLVYFLDYDAYHATPFTDSATHRPQVVLTVDDLGNAGAVGGPNIVSTTLHIQVDSMANLPPVLVAVSPVLVAEEDVRQSLKGVVQISDPDMDRTFGALMELTVDVAHGHVVITSDLGIQKMVDGHRVVVRGALDHVQYALDSSYYIGAIDWFGHDAITLTANDLGATGGAHTTTVVVPVHVASVCDAPSWRVPMLNPTAAATHFLQVVEDHPLYVSLDDVVLAVYDPEFDRMGHTRRITLTLQATFGGLMLPSTKGLRVLSPPVVHPSLPPFFYSSVSVQGTVAALNLALQALVFKSARDWTSHALNAGVQYDVVKLQLQGEFCDSDTTLDDVMTLFVDVLAANDPPTITFLDKLWETSEDTPLTLGHLPVNDVDSNVLQVTVSCSNGWVSLSGPATLWRQAGNASLDATATIQGTVLDLQATTVVFTPAPTYSGSAFVQVNVSDLVAPTVSTTLDIRVLPVLTPMQVLVPSAVVQVNPSTSVRVPTVALPPVLLPAAPVYVPPTPSSLFKSELIQPDTKFGLWGVGESWRSTRVRSSGSSPTFFTAFQGRILFQATDATYGSELWQSDGQVTMRLSDLIPGQGSASPTHPMVFSSDSKVYFAADGLDLSWRPPAHLQDACQGVRLSSFHGGGSVAFVVGHSTTWQPNAVYECPPGYLWASTAQGMDLFRTAQGTDEMSAVRAPPFTYYNQCGWQGYTWGSQVRECFRFSDSKVQTGTSSHAGKRESFRVELGNFSPQAFAGIVCVQQPAVARTAYGRELWSYDGTTFSRVGDLNPGPAGSNPAFMTEFQNTIVFQATDHDRGVELWVYDAASGAAALAVDIEAGNRSSFPKFFTVFQSTTVFFTAETAAFGAELWMFDGTVATLVADVCVGVCSSSPASLAALPSWLVFQASDGTHGAELWRTDGITTTLVMDIFPGPDGSTPTGMTVYNGRVYFSATDGTAGRELWVTDGTVTSMLVDLQPGFQGSAPSYFTVVSPGTRSSVAVPPMLVFMATKDGVASLWSIESISGAVPTRPPTLLVANVHVDVAAMGQMPQPAEFGIAGNTLYYPATANDQDSLWASKVQSAWMTTPSPWVSKRQSIFIQDVDKLGTDIQVELNCSQGLLTLADMTLVNFVRSSRRDSPRIVVQGPVVAVNAALRDVVYTAATNATGSDVIRITVWRVGAGESWMRPVSNTIAVAFVGDD
ncbi:hypothetical protein DYB32_006207, partial [Aphanomyces invadans]